MRFLYKKNIFEKLQIHDRKNLVDCGEQPVLWDYISRQNIFVKI